MEIIENLKITLTIDVRDQIIASSVVGRKPYPYGIIKGTERKHMKASQNRIDEIEELLETQELRRILDHKERHDAILYDLLDSLLQDYSIVNNVVAEIDAFADEQDDEYQEYGGIITCSVPIIITSSCNSYRYWE